jgi:hypothetical protein
MSQLNRIQAPTVSLTDVKGRQISMQLPPAGVVERRNVQRREALVRRIVGEFEELPGLTLSLRQTMRMLGVDEAACLRILDGLSRAGHIRRDSRHMYVRRERVL